MVQKTIAQQKQQRKQNNTTNAMSIHHGLPENEKGKRVQQLRN